MFGTKIIKKIYPKLSPFLKLWKTLDLQYPLHAENNLKCVDEKVQINLYLKNSDQEIKKKKKKKIKKKINFLSSKFQII